MQAGDTLGPSVAAQTQRSQSGGCALRDHRAVILPFFTASPLHRDSNVPLQLTMQTHLAYTSPVTSEQMLKQPKSFIFQKKKNQCSLKVGPLN